MSESGTNWIFATLVSLTVGLTAPVATYCHGSRQIDLEQERARNEQEKELRESKAAEAQHRAQAEFEAKKLKQEATLGYLRTATDGDLTPEMRQRVFRFLSIALVDDPLKNWADDELSRAQTKVDEIKVARATVKKLQIDLDEEHSSSLAERQRLRDQLERAQVQLAEAQGPATTPDTSGSMYECSWESVNKFAANPGKSFVRTTSVDQAIAICTRLATRTCACVPAAP